VSVEEKELLRELLHQQFGAENVELENDHAHVTSDSYSATIQLPLRGFKVESSRPELKARVEAALSRLSETLYPIKAK